MSDTTDLGKNVERLETAPRLAPYSRVTAWYTDEDAFTAGDDTGRTLEVDLPFATQEIVNQMLERVKGYVYQPWNGLNAILDPAAELGDGVTVNGIGSLLGHLESRFDALMTSDVGAPGEQEVDHEYPYVSPANRALRRKVSLGKPYYGLTITQDKGLEIQKTSADGKNGSRALLNSDVFALYNDDGSEALFFDTNEGRFKFSGLVNVADNFLVDAGGNVTIKGNINLSDGTITWGNNKPSTNIPNYLHSTYIGPTVIQSPTIEANEFNVRPDDEDDYSGSFNIYGMQLGAQYHMLAIKYQGYNAATTPYVDICSPGGANLYINYGNQDVSHVRFFGTVDFRSATVRGLSSDDALDGYVYIDGDDIIFDCGAIVARMDSQNRRVNVWFVDSAVGWRLDEDGWSRFTGEE